MDFRNFLRILGRNLGVFSYIIGLLIFPLSTCADADNVQQEHQVKAAFLYNFAKFVEWPASSFKDAQAPLTICIFGNDSLKTALDNLKDKQVEGRPVAVKKISALDQAEGCHILFISSTDKDGLSQILKAVQNKKILTVGDTKGFAHSGVMINLVLVDNKMGFEINQAAAEQATLKVSSKLLKLGKIVK